MHFRDDEAVELQSRVDGVDVLVCLFLSECYTPFTDHLQRLVNRTRHLGPLLRKDREKGRE